MICIFLKGAFSRNVSSGIWRTYENNETAVIIGVPSQHYRSSTFFWFKHLLLLQ